MIAHSLRLGGYDTEISQREQAPHFLRLGLFLSVCVGIGLLSFFRSFEHLEYISTHGLFFLLIYDGVVLQAVANILLATATISFLLSRMVLPGSSHEQLQLTVRLTAVSLLFVSIYFYFTYPNTANYLWTEHIFEKPLSYGMRVLYTEFIFILAALSVVTNSFLGVVAQAKRGDFFDMDHRRAFALNCIPAAIAFTSSLPRNAVAIADIHPYIVAAVVLYFAAFTVGLHLEFGQED
jgi:hypothetical protein